ncbi:MAG: AEC family transporter, partial [Christensenellaceae bacterium]|nr:AEC family transporter [Christensenellaceae bacterium]
FSSVPFDSYLIMFLVSLSGFRLPEVILTVCENIASANAFLCMFMIGLMFKIELKGNLRRVLSIVGLRFLLNCLIAAFLYFCLPFGEEIRRVLVIASFSPISAMAPVFSMMLGLDKGTAGAANSLSIPIAIAVITGLLVLWP